MRLAALTAALLLLPFAAASPLLVPQNADADVPTATTPIATAYAFVDERFSYTEGVRTRTIDVPTGWDRVVLTFSSRPDRDPWDRLFSVGIGGANVLQGTTPRTTFTITKDVTEYTALLPQGGTTTVQLYMGTYVGALLGSVRLDFYASEPTAALVAPARDTVEPIVGWAYIAGGSTLGRNVTFPDAPPSRVTLDLRTSGHGAAGEFWWMQTPPAVADFRVLVDGVEVGHATAMPYVYALIGFEGGPIFNDRIHPTMWWTAQRGADMAGFHTGAGEIPAYRADVDAQMLPHFTGARRVELVQDTGAGVWISSLNVLVDQT